MIDEDLDHSVGFEDFVGFHLREEGQVARLGCCMLQSRHSLCLGLHMEKLVNWRVDCVGVSVSLVLFFDWSAN